MPKVPSLLVVGLLAAQFLVFQVTDSPEPNCTLNIERPHYSTSLSEIQNIDAIKLNITSTCNVSQKYTQLTADIQKIQNNREITAYSFENERRSSTSKTPNVVTFKDLFAPCKKNYLGLLSWYRAGLCLLEKWKKGGREGRLRKICSDRVPDRCTIKV